MLEREILRTLGAGCHDAVGVHTRINGGSVDISVLLERNSIQHSCSFSIEKFRLTDVPQIVSRMMGI